MTPERRGGFEPSLYRFARRVCGRDYRPWVDALFGELRTIDSDSGRAAWMLGVGAIVGASLRSEGAALLFSRLRVALLGALAGALICALIARLDDEGNALDDGVFLALAIACSAIALALGSLALHRSIGGPGGGATPNGGI